MKILSFDGGGLRGILPAVLLERLGQQAAAPETHATLFAGTSTGGLLALALASGEPPQRLIRLYQEEGPRIFNDSWLDNVADLGKLRGADYSNGALKQTLKDLFGDRTLGDLPSKVLITAFDLDAGQGKQRSWKPKIFHNFPGPGDDCHERIVDVALYTTAAPTYFPSVNGFIDGGVYANNPSMCALAQCLDRRACPHTRLEDLVLLSLGTGRIQQYVKGKTLDWGLVQWAKPLLNLMMDATAGIADFQCRQLLQERYFRVDPTFPTGKGIAMDDVNALPTLERLARNLELSSLVSWLRHHWFPKTPEVSPS